MMLALLLRALARFGFVHETHLGFEATGAAQALRSGDRRFLQALLVLVGPAVEHSEWRDLAEIVRPAAAAVARREAHLDEADFASRQAAT